MAVENRGTKKNPRWRYAFTIRGLHWHDLRHTFGTRLAEAGCSEATISEPMGHTDPKTTRRYTHGTDRAKREAIEAARPRVGEEKKRGQKGTGNTPRNLSPRKMFSARSKVRGGAG